MGVPLKKSTDRSICKNAPRTIGDNLPSCTDELREIISQVVGKMSIANAECKLDELKSTLTKEGHVEEKGGQMSYVANDFMEKLKTRGETPLSPRKQTHMSIPTINPNVIDHLEKDCIQLSNSVDAVMKELTKSLNTITAISVANTQACAGKVADVETKVESSVRNMYSLLAQCEELDTAMEPVYKLAAKISNLKEVVSTLETYVH